MSQFASPFHVPERILDPEDLTYPVEEDEDFAYDRVRQEEIDGRLAPIKGDGMSLTGWSSDYYVLPEDAEQLQDLVEHRNMNFAVGNIFKAAYRLGGKFGTTEVYDLDKIIWFATRERARLIKAEEGKNLDEKV
jgi:hypothetical protein